MQHVCIFSQAVAKITQAGFQVYNSTLTPFAFCTEFEQVENGRRILEAVREFPLRFTIYPYCINGQRIKEPLYQAVNKRLGLKAAGTTDWSLLQGALKEVAAYDNGLSVMSSKILAEVGDNKPWVSNMIYFGAGDDVSNKYIDTLAMLKLKNPELYDSLRLCQPAYTVNGLYGLTIDSSKLDHHVNCETKVCYYSTIALNGYVLPELPVNYVDLPVDYSIYEQQLQRIIDCSCKSNDHVRNLFLNLHYFSLFKRGDGDNDIVDQHCVLLPPE